MKLQMQNFIIVSFSLCLFKNKSKILNSARCPFRYFNTWRLIRRLELEIYIISYFIVSSHGLEPYQLCVKKLLLYRNFESMFFIKGTCGFEPNTPLNLRVNKAQSDSDGLGFGADSEDSAILLPVHYLGSHSGH